MGCSASKPKLVNEFRDVKLEQIQNAKLTPPSVGHVVAQPRQVLAQQKPSAEGQPGFFDANLTFANVVWNNATKASSQPAKPALKSVGTYAAAPTLAAPKAALTPPKMPTPKPPVAPAAAAWPVADENWGEEDEDDEYWDEDEDAARTTDPDMFRTRVNHANFEWEGNGEHIDVLPKKDDKSMVNPFVGVALPLGGQPLAKPPQVSMYQGASPLEKAAAAIAKENNASNAPSLLASPLQGVVKPTAAKPPGPTAMASPFTSGAKPMNPASSAAIQSIMMNGTAEQQAIMRNMMRNQQEQALAQHRAQAAFATAPAGAGGGMYPAVQHGQQQQIPNGQQQLPGGYTPEMLLQVQQARALQQQQQQGWA